MTKVTRSCGVVSVDPARVVIFWFSLEKIARNEALTYLAQGRLSRAELEGFEMKARMFLLSRLRSS